MSDDDGSVKGLVSVVLPTYYRTDSLARAIESALGQSYNSIEIIVVDDSGERFAERTVRPYGVTYIAHSENMGQVNAWNTGLRVARGEYVQLLDDDDELRPEKIEKQVHCFERSPAVGLVYAGVCMPDGTLVRPDPAAREDPLGVALQTYLPGGRTSSLLIRRDVLEQLTPLVPREAATDVRLRIELARRSEFDLVDEILTDINAVDERQSDSIEFAHEIENVLREYRELYDQQPPVVRRGALSYMHEVKAHQTLKSTLWSPSAIWSYLKAAYYSGGRRSIGSTRDVLILTAAASLFGRPGLAFASMVRKAVWCRGT